MREAAKKFEFEKAAKLRDTIKELRTKEFLFFIGLRAYSLLVCTGKSGDERLLLGQKPRRSWLPWKHRK